MDKAIDKGVWMLATLILLAVGAASGGGFVAISRKIGTPATVAAIVVIPFFGWLMLSAFRYLVQSARTTWEALRWWHLLWFLSFASMLVFRVRGAEDIQENPLDGWALVRIVLDGVVAVILLVRLALRRTDWVASLFRGLPCILAVYGIICILSTAWSVFPLWTLYKSCEIMVDITLMAAVLASIDSIEEYRSFLNWTWFLYGLLLVSAWIGAVVDPAEALYGQGFPIGVLGFQLKGVMPSLSANDVGTFGALLATVAAARLLPLSGRVSGKAWYGMLLGASVITMVCAQTRSAIIGFVFAVFLLLIYSRRYAFSALTTFVLTPLLILSSAGGLLRSFLARGQTEQQLGHMSSRLDWWTFAWDKFVERPLTGFGAYAGGRFAVLAQHGLNKTSTLHSDYVEILVGTGFWGLLAVLAALAGVWWYLRANVKKQPPDSLEAQTSYEAIAVLGLLSVRSLFMTMLLWHAPLHFLGVLGLAEFLRRRELAVHDWEEVGAWPRQPNGPLPTTEGVEPYGYTQHSS